MVLILCFIACFCVLVSWAVLAIKSMSQSPLLSLCLQASSYGCISLNLFGKLDRFLFLMQCTVVHYVLQGRKYCWLMINVSCTISHGLVHFILNMYNFQNPLYNLLQNTNFALLLKIEILNIETNLKIQLGINTAYGLPCNFSWRGVATLDFSQKVNLKVRTTFTEGVCRTKCSDDTSHNSSPPSQDSPQEKRRAITCAMAGHEGLVSWGALSDCDGAFPQHPVPKPTSSAIPVSALFSSLLCPRT